MHQIYANERIIISCLKCRKIKKEEKLLLEKKKKKGKKKGMELVDKTSNHASVIFTGNTFDLGRRKWLITIEMERV